MSEFVNWNGRKMLVLDSNFMSRIYFKSLFELYGATAFTVGDIDDAIQIVKENSRIDLFVVDIGSDFSYGERTLRKIRELMPAIVSIAISNDIRQEGRLSKSDFNDFLIKPVRLALLKGKITTSFNGVDPYGRTI